MNKGTQEVWQEFQHNKDSDPDWSDPLAHLTIFFFSFFPHRHLLTTSVFYSLFIFSLPPTSFPLLTIIFQFFPYQTFLLHVKMFITTSFKLYSVICNSLCLCSFLVSLFLFCFIWGLFLKCIAYMSMYGKNHYNIIK